MKAETITGAMGTLEEAGFPEEQRMAIVKAIAEMQQPLFDAIENLGSRFEKLESKMDDRFEKVKSDITDLRAEVIGRDVRLAKRDTWLIFSGIAVSLSTVGMLIRMLIFSTP